MKEKINKNLLVKKAINNLLDVIKFQEERINYSLKEIKEVNNEVIREYKKILKSIKL